jgi:hypothetical protein
MKIVVDRAEIPRLLTARALCRSMVDYHRPNVSIEPVRHFALEVLQHDYMACIEQYVPLIAFRGTEQLEHGFLKSRVGRGRRSLRLALSDQPVPKSRTDRHQLLSG